MSRHRRAAVVLAAVTVAAACPSAAAAQDETILAVEREPTGVTALEDVVAWSSYDPSIKRFRLVASTGGAPPRRLPVPTRARPFDADLGRDGDGRLVLAYSRCRYELSFEGESSGAPYYSDPEDCRLYRYRLGDRREYRIDSGRWPGASDFLPSLWRGRIAFIRKGRPPGARRLLRLSGQRLIVRSLKSGRERVVPVPRGPVGRDATRFPTVVDLAGPRLLSVWQYQDTTCRRRVPVADDDKIEPAGSEVFRGPVRRLRRIAEACDTDPVQEILDAAQFGRLSFSLDKIDLVTERRTYSPSGKVLASRPIPSRAYSLAVARSGTYYATIASDPASDSNTYPIVRTKR